MPKRRLTLVIHSLAGGGAERIASMMANAWAKNENEVTLITLDTPQSDRYRLAPSISRIALGVMKQSSNLLAAIWNNWKRVRLLRDTIQASRPDKVISISDKTNVLTLLACKKSKTGVIIVEQVDPSRHSIGIFWSWLRRRTYPHCSALVILSERSRKYSQTLVRNRPIYVIPNAISFSKPVSRKVDDSQKNEYSLVAMGRLAPQKGFDLLIEAFSQISQKHPQWHLKILGEGSLQSDLERLIEQRHMKQRIELLGWVDNPSELLGQCDLFVLSSRYEGIPLALLEAMACGLPVISFDCETGPAEIIRPEIDGLLVPPEDVDGLRGAIDRLISNSSLRKQMAQRASETDQRFGIELFLRRWEAVLVGIDAAEFEKIQ